MDQETLKRLQRCISKITEAIKIGDSDVEITLDRLDTAQQLLQQAVNRFQKAPKHAEQNYDSHGMYRRIEHARKLRRG